MADCLLEPYTGTYAVYVSLAQRVATHNIQDPSVTR